MLHASAGALGSAAGHFMFRAAHGIAHFASQGLAFAGSECWDCRHPEQHLHAQNRSCNSISLHFASSPVRRGVSVPMMPRYGFSRKVRLQTVVHTAALLLLLEVD